MAVTTTRKGITSKQLLLGTQADQVSLVYWLSLQVLLLLKTKRSAISILRLSVLFIQRVL